MQAFAAALNKGFLDQELPRRLHPGRSTTRHHRRHGLRPAQRPRPGGLLVQQDAARPVRLRRAQTWEDYRRSATSSPPSIPATSSAPSATLQGPYIYYWRRPGAGLPGRRRRLQLRHRRLPTRSKSRRSSTTCSRTARSRRTASSAPTSWRSADKLVAIPGRPGIPARCSRTRPASTPRPASRRRRPADWEGGDMVTGNVGGGVWYASSHTKNLDAVKTFLEFVMSADEKVGWHSGLPGLQARGRQVAREAGRAASTSRRLQAPSCPTPPEAVWNGWGFTKLVPGDRVGQGHHPRRRGGQDASSRCCPMAEGDEERSPGRRLHGRVT